MMSSHHTYNNVDAMMIPWTGYCDEKTTTRRWNSSASGNGNMKTIAERRKQDHGHCVEMVQTRDYEGYRKEFAFAFDACFFGVLPLRAFAHLTTEYIRTEAANEANTHFLSVFCPLKNSSRTLRIHYLFRTDRNMKKCVAF